MDCIPPLHRDAFRADLLIGLEANRAKVTPKTRTGKDNTWTIWCLFCDQQGQDPYLSTYPCDPLDFFIVFGLRYRRGDIAKDKRGRLTTGPGVRGGSVSTALQAIGERFTELGRPDPRKLTGSNELAPRLQGLYKFFKKEDPPSSRIWPACLHIVRACQQVLQKHPDEAFAQAALDLIIIGFFFLCRPGEYALSTNTDQGRSSPFRLCDINFGSPQHLHFNAATCPLNDVNHAQHVAFTFTDQKNAVKGESIGQSSNQDKTFNPVEAAKRRVLHLRLNNASPTTPIYNYYTNLHSLSSAPKPITTRLITNILRQGAASVQHLTGIPPERISSYSLRSGGATALMCANVSNDAISLIGRWKSDAMFRYLRTQAREYNENFSQAMLDHGAYTFSPSSSTPESSNIDLLPQETPPRIAAALGILQVP